MAVFPPMTSGKPWRTKPPSMRRCQNRKNPATDPHAPKPGDSAPVAEWRQRMGTEEAKCLYKDRAATAECVNALARNRGLNQCRVRGTAKVRCVLLFHALAHNLLRTVVLAPEWLGLGTGTPTTVSLTA